MNWGIWPGTVYLRSMGVLSTLLKRRHNVEYFVKYDCDAGFPVVWCEHGWSGIGKGTCRATSVAYMGVVESYETPPLNPQAHAFEKDRLEGKGLGSKVETGNEEVSSVTMLSQNEWTSRNHEGRVSRCHRALDGEEP
jgi:hypothetical protein